MKVRGNVGYDNQFVQRCYDASIKNRIHMRTIASNHMQDTEVSLKDEEPVDHSEDGMYLPVTRMQSLQTFLYKRLEVCSAYTEVFCLQT